MADSEFLFDGEVWEKKVYRNKHTEINDWLRSKETTGKSRRTLNEYSRTAKKFFHEEFPELDPEDVTVRDIEEYLAKLNQRGLSQNTKRRYLESLSAFYSWALQRPRYQEITGNPAAVILEEVPKNVPERPDCATWENAKAIVDAVEDPRNFTLTAILAKTGCRASEACEIKLDDLLLEEGFIRLRKRKGGKQTVVPIDNELKQVIEFYQTLRTSKGTDYLFESVKGGKMKRKQLRKHVRNAAVKAGVMEEGETRFHKKFTPHTFRTVFTTQMRNQGMPDHILKYIRGDSKTETMDIYTRVDRTQARKQYLNCIKKLNTQL
ncbi:recombinase [Haloarcula mannanilytica]|uniref:Recombinase n=1 Tax=Haloarcula mannanilytica TaxID=2509225 RepID=A0A4C2EL19_9EURY|nr:tyrosine-type recombinase/integrase [Haloarcula mannanilytica]GCF15046.1 recombinase [Haloarcula mannanilytica]